MGIFISIYRAQVYDNKDPESRGRLQIKIPTLWGDQVHDYWALPMGMFTGNGIGFAALPQKEDTVWIMFENGDQRFPVWNYGFWAEGKNALKDTYDADGSPLNAQFRTVQGHTFFFDKDKIDLKHSDGNYYRIDKQGIYNVTDKFTVGSLDAQQPMILGNTFKDLLDALIEEISKATVTTELGQMPLLNAAQILAFKAQTHTILSTVGFINK